MQNRIQNIFSNQYSPIIALLFGSFLIVFGTYYPFFSNDYLLSGGGDGLKHYYTLSYLMKYGHGWDFEGMAYPYGEHFIFVDGHGIVGRMMQTWSQHVFDISDKAVVIIHFWMFFWFVISPLFLYKILRHFTFKPWEAVLTALLIFTLSPQWHRLFGHQALSYILFIPLLWWLLIKISAAEKRWIWASCYGSIALFFGFIHPYYLPLAAMFALAYMATSFYKNGQFDFKKAITLFLTAFIPLIIFQVYMFIADPFPGERGYVAGGFFQYMATFEGVFLPNFGRYFDFWQSLTGVRVQNYEAFNYVGFAGQIVFLAFVISFIKKLFNRQFSSILNFCDNAELNQYLQAAFLTLLFAFALVFQWFPILLEKLPPLRQFRSLGRFGWIFYYVFTVFTAYQIKNWLSQIKLKNRWFAIVIGISFVGIWAIEGYQNIQHFRREIINNITPNYFLQKEFTNILLNINKKPSAYQAIIPAPGFHLGSDKLAIVKSGNGLGYAFRASYDLHLPIAGYYSTRAPIAKTFEVLRWFSDDLTRRESEFELYNDKPFLIISANEKLDEADKELLAKAKLIYESKAYNFYELDINDYKKGFETKQKKALKTYFEHRDSLYKINDSTFTNKETKAIYFNGFSDYSNIWKQEEPFGNKNYFGRGNQHVLFDGKLPKDSIGQELELSVWVYSNEDLPSMPILKCEVFDKNNVLIEKPEVLGMHSTTTFGRWVRISMTIKASEHRNQIYLGYYNNFKIFNCWADNFLIRPTDVNVWNTAADDIPYYNGYILK
jgi:hypothetical protein